jgi:hypothetical protein
MRFSISALASLALVFTTGAAAPPDRSPQRLAMLLAEADRSGLTDDRKTAIDNEAAQKDAWRSRLFWHTDLQRAVAAANSSGKPILSLRLLGRLDEELSCANSRFFRKTLYIDPAIARILSDRFILHWESLRPVPLVSIDFGDGHVVKRTLTGNSIHYLLASDGKVIDALPGLMNADTFRRELTAFADAITAHAGANPPQLAAYYRSTLERIQKQPIVEPPATTADVSGERSADRAGRIAESKLILQLPLLQATRNPSAAVLADTLKNQRSIRPQILAWLQANPTIDLKVLNNRVYRDLFLSPLDDPQMGLDAPDESALFTSQQLPTAPEAVKYTPDDAAR